MNMIAFMMIELAELGLLVGNLYLLLKLQKKSKEKTFVKEPSDEPSLDLTEIELETWKEIQNILNYDGNLPKEGGNE